MKSIPDPDGLIQIIIPPGAYEIESLNNEINGLFFMKNIPQNLVTHSQSNQIF